ncbi:GTP 3',8-cyclase [Streptomyces tendae]
MAVTEDRSAPAWLAEATTAAWQMPVPTGPLWETLLVRERSAYGYVKAAWEINLGCDHDCGFCYLGEKRFECLDCDDKTRLLTMLRDAGVLWLQITGGEALIDPQFAAAYEYATGLGMVIQISTNGSQLHKVRMQELFVRLRPYRLTVSLYGATGETYDAVTRNRGAFDRFTRGLDASRTAGLPVRIHHRRRGERPRGGRHGPPRGRPLGLPVPGLHEHVPDDRRRGEAARLTGPEVRPRPPFLHRLQRRPHLLPRRPARHRLGLQDRPRSQREPHDRGPDRPPPTRRHRRVPPAPHRWMLRLLEDRHLQDMPAAGQAPPGGGGQPTLYCQHGGDGA